MNPWLAALIGAVPSTIAAGTLWWYHRREVAGLELAVRNSERAADAARTAQRITEAARVQEAEGRVAAERDRNAARTELWRQRADTARKVQNVEDALAAWRDAARRLRDADGDERGTGPGGPGGVHPPEAPGLPRPGSDGH